MPSRKTPRTTDPAQEPADAPRVLRRPVKAPERVSLDIIRDIVAQGLKPGDRLPLETDMLALYGVSRPTLREALRMLEIQGLIVIKTRVGMTVGRASPINLARSLTLYLTLAGVSYQELLDAWRLAEPLLARMAAANPDRERVADLIGPHVDADKPDHDESHDIAAGYGLHAAIGKLAGNRVLSLLLMSVGLMVGEEIMSLARPNRLSPTTAADHAGIAAAIVAGDEDRSSEAMAEHIAHLAEEFRAFWPSLIGGRVQSR
jgi:GntR family transcriptional repressor for pyruvate dehydrogenase complex